MKVTKKSYLSLLPSLVLGISKLKGSARRMFAGQLALDIGYGGIRLVSQTLSIDPGTVGKGIKEIKSGEPIKDQFHLRGRKPLEAKSPSILEDIRLIIDGESQTDPTFKSVRLYTRLSAEQVRKELLKRGYKEEELPHNQTIWNKMNALGYKRRKVAKTRPKKK